MGQVPAKKNKASSILIVGDGRLSFALTHVLFEKAKLDSETLIFEKWSRSSSTSFRQALELIDATHVWLAISDDAVIPFATEHKELLQGRRIVHFAGSLPSFDFVHAAHPLTTFSFGPVELDRFAKVPFVLDRGGPELTDLMPGFENPTYRIDPDRRDYYHALCTMSGNFTVLLWETVASRFESELAIPRAALASYRHQIFENLARSGTDSVLTGPLVRGDSKTIRKHHDSLLAKFEMPLLKIYDGFVDLYRTFKRPTGAT